MLFPEYSIWLCNQIEDNRNQIWSNVWRTTKIEAVSYGWASPRSIFLRIFLPVHFVSEYLTTAGGFRRHGTHGISGKSRTKTRERKERREDTRRLEGSRSFLFDGWIRVAENLRKWKRNAPWERMGIPSIPFLLRCFSFCRTPFASLLFFFPLKMNGESILVHSVSHVKFGHEASKLLHFCKKNSYDNKLGFVLKRETSTFESCRSVYSETILHRVADGFFFSKIQFFFTAESKIELSRLLWKWSRSRILRKLSLSVTSRHILL